MDLINQTQEIKNLTEDIFIEPKGIFPGIYANHKYHYTTHEPSNKIIKSYIPEMTIQRNLRDDTFNVKLKLDKHFDLSVRSNFQIDSKTIESHIPVHDKGIFNNVVNDILPHSLIKDAKFNKTKTIAAGLVLQNPESSDEVVVSPRYSRKDVGAFLIIINNLVKNQNISVNSDDIIHIKTINSIRVTKDKPLYIWKNSHRFSNSPYDHPYKILKPNEQNDQEVSLEYSYNHIYLKPAPISRYDHNTKIYDVFMSNDDGTPIIGDMNIENGVMSTSESGNSKMQIGFHSELNKNQKEVIDGKSRDYIGYYSLEDYSYYDYDKKTTIFGPSTNAKTGDLVPYNLGGNYIRQIGIALNCDYDALKIYQSKTFDKPILKPFSGSVKINLENKEFDYSIKMHKISKTDMKNIKENFDEYLLNINTQDD